MRELIKVFKALSDPARIRIIKLLEKKSMCVCELTRVLGAGQPNVSHHLGILKDAGLVNDVKDGLWVNYELSRDKYNKYAPKVLDLLSSLLNDDPGIGESIRKARKTRREDICRQ